MNRPRTITVLFALLTCALALALAACLPEDKAQGATRTVKPLGWNWVCHSAGRDYVDPIVSPGTYPTGHKHDFFGAKPKPDTTFLKLRAMPNNCEWPHNPKDEGNKASYWEPVPVNKTTGQELRTTQVNTYYRVPQGVSPGAVKPYPAGLKYVVGSPDAKGAQPHIFWRCAEEKGSGRGTPVDCGAGGNVKISYFLPSCSDGRADSANHKAHLVYPGKNGCPASHPRPVPALNMSFGLMVSNGKNVTFKDREGNRIAPHADFFTGTPRKVYRHWIHTCIQDPKGGCFGTGVAGKRNP